MYECKTVQDMICLMSSKIKEMGESLSDQQVSSFINEILGADRIYVMGAGRVGACRQGLCNEAHASWV
jgi:hypothetical protein